MATRTELSRTATVSRAQRLRDRSAQRREAERGEMRALLLSVAEHQLQARGYSAFSLREVAEAARYTPTTVYRYFADRDALLEAVLQKWFLRFALALEAADASATTPEGRLLAQGEAYIRFALDNPAMYRVLFVERVDIGVLPDGRGLEDDRAFGCLIGATRAWHAAGGLPGHDPFNAAMQLWMGLHGVATLAVTSVLLDRDGAIGLGRALARTLLRGLQLPP